MGRWAVASSSPPSPPRSRLLPSPSSAATVLALLASRDVAASTGAGLPAGPRLVGAMDGGGEPLLVPLGMGRRAMARWAAGAGDLAWPCGGRRCRRGVLVASVWGLRRCGVWWRRRGSGGRGGGWCLAVCCLGLDRGLGFELLVGWAEYNEANGLIYFSGRSGISGTVAQNPNYPN